MISDYCVLLKTAQAEFRCWNHLSSETKGSITPIVELTRGRKISGSGRDINPDEFHLYPGIFGFERNVDKVVESFEGSTLFLDLTNEQSLTCFELEELRQSNDNYASWTSFCNEIAENFNNLIPVIQVNPGENETEDEYIYAIQQQFDHLSSISSAVAYRAYPVSDPDFLYDLHIFRDHVDRLQQEGGEFYIRLDHEYIRQGTSLVHAARALGLINQIDEIVPGAKLIILSTSYPQNISEVGNPEEGQFPLEEVNLFEQIRRQLNIDRDVYYADYGSINPYRNDLNFAVQWRPRVVFPTQRSIYYYSEKKEYDYEDHYADVAQAVMDDPRFEELEGSWGVDQIVSAAEGQVNGKAPSFWISVRMDIHIHQQLRRLNPS